MSEHNTQNVYRIKIAGQAGQGVKSAGLMLAKFASRSGLNIYNHVEYPSLIRGGHNVMQINISDGYVSGPSTKTDLLVALNQDAIDFHIDEFVNDSYVIYDSGGDIDLTKIEGKAKLFGIPLGEIAKESGGKELLSNTVALGAVVALLGGDVKVMELLVSEEFSDKGSDLINSNVLALSGGSSYIKENFSESIKQTFNFTALKKSLKDKMVLNGDEAAALGAISAGVQFVAIYPMSPISNILHVLAAYQEEYKFIYKQPEDEISAINMAIGASYAGARSMTATSGGGFALMTEGFGLAGMTETPLVVIEGQRGSPATGLPTWSEQGDLRMVLHAHQGEFPRIVLTPGDVTETFYLTMEAFYIADKYQTPVVVLIDRNICDNEQSVKMFDVSSYKIDRGKLELSKVDDYQRYSLSSDGISERTIPGIGNFFIANSDEHNTYGYSIEDVENRNAQMSKRMKKLEVCAQKDMPEQMLYGPENADLTIVSWGSNKGSILQALENFPQVNYLHITWMNPFPTSQVEKILKNAKIVLDIETNYIGQLAGIIREKTGIEIKNKMLKNDGRPFYVEDVIDKINLLLKGGEQ